MGSALVILFGVFMLSGAGVKDGDFMYANDKDLYGEADVWTYPKTDKGIFPGEFDDLKLGDCEDYAIMKIVDAGKGELLTVDAPVQSKYVKVEGTTMWKERPVEGHAIALIDGVVHDVNHLTKFHTPDISEYTIHQRYDYDDVVEITKNGKPSLFR